MVTRARIFPQGRHSRERDAPVNVQVTMRLCEALALQAPELAQVGDEFALAALHDFGRPLLLAQYLGG